MKWKFPAAMLVQSRFHSILACQRPSYSSISQHAAARDLQRTTGTAAVEESIEGLEAIHAKCVLEVDWLPNFTDRQVNGQRRPQEELHPGHRAISSIMTDENEVLETDKENAGAKGSGGSSDREDCIGARDHRIIHQ